MIYDEDEYSWFMITSVTECSHPVKFVYKDEDGYEHCLLCVVINLTGAMKKLTEQIAELTEVVDVFALTAHKDKPL